MKVTNRQKKIGNVNKKIDAKPFLESNKKDKIMQTLKSDIPPLIKYTQTIRFDLQNKKKQIQIQTVKQKSQRTGQNTKDNFHKNKRFQKSPKDEQYGNQQVKTNLLKLQQRIAAKYKIQTQTNINQNQDKFNQTQKLERVQSALIHYQRKQNSIQHLKGTQLQNNSIEKINNWVLDKDQLSIDQQAFYKNITNQNQISGHFQSFRKNNPLDLVYNTLHSSYQPQFVQDDYFSQSFNQNRTNKFHFQDIDEQQNQEKYPKQENIINPNIKTIQSNLNIKAIKSNLTMANQFLLQNKQKSSNIHKQNQDNKKNVSNSNERIEQITLKLYNHYLSQNRQFLQINSLPNQLQKSIKPQSILINEQNQIFHDSINFTSYTARSSPIQKEKSSTQRYNVSGKSDTERDYSTFTNRSKKTQVTEHFIKDKNVNQIVRNVLSDQSKFNLYLKYIQCEIALCDDQKIREHYQLLTVFLLKIQQMTSNRILNDQPKLFAQLILQAFNPSKKTNQNNDIRSFKPHIIIGNNEIKIDYDPYLKHQKDILNQKISYLKKQIQQKQKINLICEAYIRLDQKQLLNISQQFKEQKKKSEENSQQNNPIEFDFPQNKSDNKLASQQIHNNQYMIEFSNRDSIEGKKLHRKTTFGRAPSFRASKEI